MTKRLRPVTLAAFVVPVLALAFGGCSSRDPAQDDPSASALDTTECQGPEGPPSTSPYSDPPRCEMREIMLNGQLTRDDPRALWCEYGACGKSGEATCRTVEETTQAQTFTECDTGAVKCKRCGFRRVECGTTQGCIDHDACYDERYRNNEIDSFDLWMALRAYCDVPIAANYPVADWSAWMQGKPGPSGFSSYLPYQEALECQVSDGACE